ncbi:MAG: Nif3-like dinuclear metal center hexameric protein [Saprospiraceae bacterium]|nr:Nif3-like dinuclear metal center hexameric protein [Saprospiraceae bacterium]
MTTIKELTDYLETIAPPGYQEVYDNSGLVVGNHDAQLTGVIICLDSTEDVVREAIAKKCNLIIAHHPIIFNGLKKLNGKTYIEKTIILAIKNDIAIYAIHTNLDNVLENGVNQKIAEKLGLGNCRILLPKAETLMNLTFFVPINSGDDVVNALYAAGAGQIGNYKNCSFRTTGTGTFTPTGSANPTIGELNKVEQVEESRIELIFPEYLTPIILKELMAAHPYEEVSYFLQKLENIDNNVGAGLIGELPNPTASDFFLEQIKEKLNVECIRYTKLVKSAFTKVAVCGGAGSFLLKQAIANGADIFISADFKYHEFFDANDKITIADIGHFESEQHTIKLLFDIINKKFSNFAVHLTQVVTNPVKYL